MIDLLKEENESDSDAQFYNKCKIIQNLNPFELNTRLFDFLSQRDSIPQYKKIEFPKLDKNDNENEISKKIKDIYVFLDVIKSSLKINTENIRFELFKKYNNQNEKLAFINKVLESLNKKKLNKTEVNSLKGKVQSLSENLIKTTKSLFKEKCNLKNLESQLSSQTKLYEQLYEESQNIKYRDICSYIIDYFTCILDDENYDYVMNSDYKTAITYIVNEINTNYTNYKTILLKDKIILGDLLNSINS